MNSIIIGTDHRGYAHKEYIIHTLSEYNWIDVGAFSPERSDYPLFAHKAAQAIVDKQVDLGVLICATGIGMAITANRYVGVYAGVVWDVQVAELARAHDNVNVLVIPSDYIDLEGTVLCITTWLQAKFLQGRYAQRIAMIDKR